jgi:hypothetical protein
MTMKILIKNYFWGIIGLALTAPVLVYAATDKFLPNPLGGTNTFAQLITNVAEVVFNVALPVAVMFIIYGGLKFVMARGNTTELEKAKSILTWALAGAALLLGARVIAEAVQSTIQAL